MHKVHLQPSQIDYRLNRIILNIHALEFGQDILNILKNCLTPLYQEAGNVYKNALKVSETLAISIYI